VPSVFLVAAGGTILWTHSDPDYRVRPDNASILAAALASKTAPETEGDAQGDTPPEAAPKTESDAVSVGP